VSSLNKVQLIGRVGADPEIRNTNSGDKIANLRIATSETWKDKSGERQERTSWHTVVVFNDRLAGVVESYVKKGSRIYVEGALTYREWEKDGVKRISAEVQISRFKGEIILLDSREKSDSYEAPQRQGGGGSTDSFSADLDSEIPFVTMWGMR